MDNDGRCYYCNKVASIDPVTDEYDLNQMCNWPMVKRKGQLVTGWACSTCIGIPKFSIPPRSDEDEALAEQQKNECLECGGAGHIQDHVDLQFEKCGMCRGSGSRKPRELS